MKIYITDTACLMKRRLFAKAYAAMPPERRNRVDRLRFPRDRCRSLGAGLLLHRALAEAGVDGETAFVYGEHGKPRLAEDLGLHFNLSHSGDRAMCVIDEHRVGCDVERIGRRSAGVAERFFAPDEYSFILSSPEDGRDAAFTRLWALKESFLKATGLGLTLPLSAFAVSVTEEGVSVRQDVDGNRYDFFEPEPGDGYRYAVCVQNAPALTPRIEWVDLSTIL